jgi:hypothetical protein
MLWGNAGHEYWHVDFSGMLNTNITQFFSENQLLVKADVVHLFEP